MRVAQGRRRWKTRKRERDRTIKREAERVRLRMYTEFTIRARDAETPNATCCRVETPGATEAKESNPFGGRCRYTRDWEGVENAGVAAEG